MWASSSRMAVRFLLPKQLPRGCAECVVYSKLPVLNQTAAVNTVLAVRQGGRLAISSTVVRVYHSSAASSFSLPSDRSDDRSSTSEFPSSSRKTHQPFPMGVATRQHVSPSLFGFMGPAALSTIDVSPLLYATVRRQFGTTRGRRFSWANKSPYELLNVDRNATAKDIKLAYFREAKKYHPDLNPTDPEAKEKFQAIAAAYELLSDAKRRATYDTTGSTGQQASYGGQPGGNGGGNQHYYGQQADYGGYSQQHAEDIFRSVQGDVDVIKEALGLLREEWRDEFNVMVDAMQRGDWSQVWEIAKEHRLLISAVVVPTILFVRYPPAVFAVLRLLMAGANVAVAFLVYTGNLQAAAQLIWRQIVTLSVEQKNRVEERRRKK